MQLLPTQQRQSVLWLQSLKLASSPLQDAASLCVAILSARTRGRTFMGTDNHPLTR